MGTYGSRALEEALSEVRALAEVMGMTLMPLREDDPVGLLARVQTERARLASVQRARERARARVSQRSVASGDALCAVEVRAFWSE